MLNNMQSSTGELVAVADNATAESNISNQLQVNSDFRNIEPIATYARLMNVVGTTSTDSFTSDYVFENDQIIIVLVGSEYLQLKLSASNLSANVIDTSSITSGTIPEFVYIIPEIKINNTLLILNFIETVFILQDSILTGYIVWDILTIPFSRTITTYVKIHTSGSIIKQIMFDQKQTVFAVATNTLISTDTEATSLIADAYKVFDGVEESAFSEAVDSSGVCDISHTYDFGEPITILEYDIKCGVSDTSPRSIELLGSFDNVTFVSLGVSTQEIVIDNYNIKNRIDIDNYAAYRYYKFHITEGTPSGTVSVNEYVLKKEA